MSEKLDTLLKEMNDSLDGRLEQDVPLDDPFWAKRTAYQRAYASAGGVHIPQKTEVEGEVKVDESKPLTPVEKLIQKNRENTASVGSMGGEPNAPNPQDENRPGNLATGPKDGVDQTKNFQSSSAVSEENKVRPADPLKAPGQVRSAQEQLDDLEKNQTNQDGIQPGVVG